MNLVDNKVMVWNIAVIGQPGIWRVRCPCCVETLTDVAGDHPLAVRLADKHARTHNDDESRAR